MRAQVATSACFVASGLLICGLGGVLAFAEPRPVPENAGAAHINEVAGNSIHGSIRLVRGEGDTDGSDEGQGTDSDGSDGTKPRADGTKPRVNGNKPRADGTKPRVNGNKPRADGTKPKADQDKPKADENDDKRGEQGEDERGDSGNPNNGNCGNTGRNGNAQGCGGTTEASGTSTTKPTTTKPTTTKPTTTKPTTTDETTTDEKPPTETMPTMTTSPPGLPRLADGRGGSDGTGGGALPAGPPEPPRMQLPQQVPTIISAAPGVGVAAGERPMAPITLPVIEVPAVVPGLVGAGGGSAAPANPALPPAAPANPALPPAPRVVVAEPPAGRNPLPANVGSNPVVPASSYRLGYPEYLRNAKIQQVAALAVPGVAGMLVLTGAGGFIGYRQAKAGLAVRTGVAARFVK